MIRRLGNLKRWARGAYLRLRAPGLRFGPGAYAERGAEVWAYGREDRITLGAGSALRRGVYVATFGAFCDIGAATSIGPYSVLYAQGGLTIGSRVSMGPHCVLSTGGHRFEAPGSIRDQGVTKSPIVIGDDVWIGANVTITEGVTIASDSVIAAGAVVRSDVSRGAIVGGVPAKLIRWREGYEADALAAT